MVRNLIGGGACSSAVAIAVSLASHGAPAFAQVINSAPPAASANSDLSEDEIVVTARRREERLQDVPIAVSAFNAAQLEARGIDSIAALETEVPSLNFTQASFSPTSDFQYITLRGIGAQPALDPSVGLFIDGVYQPSLGIELNFLDLERVEVLRGPQGSLFGRNTLAGAVNYVIKRPGPDFRGRATASVSSFDTYKARANVSGGLTQDLTASLGAQYESTNGWVRNAFLDTDQNNFERFSARAAVYYNPTEDLSIVLAGDYARRTGNELGRGVPFGCNCYNVRYNAPTNGTTEIYGGSLTIDYTFGAVKLSSITGARRATSDTSFDVDGTDSTQLFSNAILNVPLPVDGIDSRRTKQLLVSQELRLENNTSGRFDWLIGGYGFYEEFDIDRFSRIPLLVGYPQSVWDGSLPGGRGVLLQQPREGLAVFGQVKYNITDQLELALGGRYAWERARLDADVSFVLNASPNLGGTFPRGPLPFPPLVGTFRTSFSQFTPSGSLTWKVSPGLTTYISVSQGFKAGGFQKFPLDANSARPFGPETLWNYEIGLKGSALDNTIRGTLALFRIDSNGQQLQTSSIINGIPVGLVDNAGIGRVDGVELEAFVEPVKGLRFNGNLSYLDAKFRQYVNSDRVDRSGDRFPFVPEWSYFLAAQYTAELSDEIRVIPSVSYAYTGSYNVGDRTAVSPVFRVPSYGVTNFSLTIESDRWSARLFADNVFDKYYFVRVDTGSVPVLTAAGTTGPNPNLFVAPGEPQRIGAELTFRF